MQQIAGLRTSDDSALAVKHLINIDVEIQGGKEQSSSGLSAATLSALAAHATPTALEYLRSVFETQTHRRHDAAYAISLAADKRPSNDQDWRYLVRSLPIVQGDQALSVLRALRRFRRRATRPAWVREVILTGLKLPEADQAAALDLLKFWTGHTVPDKGNSGSGLGEWQSWFRRTYPDEPAPALPVDPDDAKWTFVRLAKIISKLPVDEDSVSAGAAVYRKASCNKCHRRDGVQSQPDNDRLGPNLTSLGWRRQPEEIVSAILYPSHRLNDEYPVTTVVLTSGKAVSGLLMPDENDQLKVVDANSKETRFAKEEVEETVLSAVSNMPAGLLEPLSEKEVTSLLAFLTVQLGDYDPHRR